MWLEILSIVLICILPILVWDNYLVNPKQPPGPFKLPSIGSLIQLYLADSRHYIAVDKLSKKYGKIMSVKMGLQNAVFISDYNAFKTIFTMEEATERAVIGVLLDRCFHNPYLGLASAGGPSWEESRKFSNEGLKPYGFGNRRVLEARLELELEIFYQNLEKLRKQNPEIVVHFTRDLFDPSIINPLLLMFIGERLGQSSGIVQEIMLANEMVMSKGITGAGILTAFPFLRYVFPKLLGFDKQLEGVKMFHQITRKIIEARREDGSYKTNPSCFIDEFLRKMEMSSTNTSIFTIENLQSIFVDLLQAGFETTGNSMNFGTLLIGSHPEVQNELVAEINMVCGSDRNPTISDRPRMPYAQAVVTEVYRWSRILVFGVLRMAASDFTYDKYFFPKGTLLLPNFHSLFFDEEFWGDPFNFRPGRFLDPDKNLNKSKVDVVATFGIGKRNCFGEIIARDVLFYFVTNLFHKYKLSVPKGSPKPNLEPKIGMTFSPYPYSLCVESRK